MTSTTPQRLPELSSGDYTPPSLHALPHDLLIKIYENLESTSALSLLKVGKAFVSPAESAIWRDLDFLNPYTKAAYLKPPKDGSTETEEDEARETEWRLAAGQKDCSTLRRRYIGMMDEANPRRWKMVKTIKAAMVQAVNDHLILLLERVSTTLESLHLELLCKTDIPSELFDESLLMLNCRLTICGKQLSFPSLTSLRLGEDTFEDITFIHFLCGICPNLSSLTFNFLSRDPPERDPADSPPPPPKYLSKPTFINYLSITYDYEVDGPQCSDEEAVCKLLGCCPNLRRLHLPVGDPLHDCHARAFLPHLKDMADLKYIIWGGQGMEVGGIWTDQATVDMVQYVRMAHYNLQYPIPDFSIKDPFSAAIQRLPRIGNMEALSFDCSMRNLDVDVYVRSVPEDVLTFLPHTTEVLPIAPDTAEWMMKNPHLHTIYIEDDDAIVEYPTLNYPSKSEPTAFFTSIRHGDSDELLHARLLVNNILIHKHDPPSRIQSRRILHTRCDSLLRHIPRITQVSPPVFHDFTYYQGEIIPLEMVQEIKEVEGITDESCWDKRGVQVGEAAWDVIRLWRERIAEELENEPLYGDDLCQQFMRL